MDAMKQIRPKPGEHKSTIVMPLWKHICAIGMTPILLLNRFCACILEAVFITFFPLLLVTLIVSGIVCVLIYR